MFDLAVQESIVATFPEDEDRVSCEAEQARVDSLQGQVSAQAGACAGICAGNMYPEDCAACRSELAGLRSDLIQAQDDLAKCRGGQPSRANIATARDQRPRHLPSGQ